MIEGHFRHHPAPLFAVRITPPAGQGEAWCMKNQTEAQANTLVKKWGAMPGYTVQKRPMSEFFKGGN